MKIKQRWYLGEACVLIPFLSDRPADHLVPSFVVGALLGPFCAGLIDANQWTEDDDVGDIAYVSAASLFAFPSHDSNNPGSYSTHHWHSNDQSWLRTAQGIPTVAIS